LPQKDDDQDGVWKNKQLKWVQCVIPKENDKSSWLMHERHSVQRSIKLLLKSQEKNDLVFLLVIFSQAHLSELAMLYLGKSPKVKRTITY
jgi:hypothetical protein